MKLLQTLLENVNPEPLFTYRLRLQGFVSKTFTTPSASLHYFENAEKESSETFVFLHGVGASAGHFHQNLVALNQSGHRVLALDLPGHGASSSIEGEVGSDAFFQAFADWMDGVAPEPIILIGNSLGGAVALRYAATYPKRVKKLILISPAGGFRSEEDWNQFKSRLKMSDASEAVQWIRDVYATPPFFAPLFGTRLFKFLSAPFIQNLVGRASYQDFDHSEKFSEDFPPILLIWGRADRIFPAHHLEAFRQQLPANKLTVLDPENIGHCPQLDSWKWLHHQIENFVFNSTTGD